MARKKARETYGSGSITPVKRDGKVVRDTWRICISLGVEEHLDKDGKLRRRQRKVQKVVRCSLADARTECKKLVDEYEHVDLSASKMTFADACEVWATSMRENGTCAPSKLKDYTTRLSYVAAHLGKKPMIQLTTSDLEDALSAVKVERNQSLRTYRDTKRHVRRVFRFARSRHWVVFDASEDLQAVRVRSHVERRSLEREEFARLRACVDRDRLAAVEEYERKEARQAGWGNTFTRTSIEGLANIGCLVGIRLLLATGMRRGELLALTWGKVNFSAGSILIDRTLNADGILKEPKTDAGIRCISVDGDTMKLLEWWRDFQKGALHRVMAPDASGELRAVGQSDGTPVVCSCVGGWFDPHHMNRWWNRYRATIGFDSLKLHEMRHTAATLLLGNGTPVVDVAARLGHSDVSVTLNTYGHAIPANDRAAADLLGSLMQAPATPVFSIGQRSA